MCQRLWEVDGWCGKLPFPAGNHMVVWIRVELFAGVRNVTNWPDFYPCWRLHCLGFGRVKWTKQSDIGRKSRTFLVFLVFRFCAGLYILRGYFAMWKCCWGVLLDLWGVSEIGTPSLGIMCLNFLDLWLVKKNCEQLEIRNRKALSLMLDVESQWPWQLLPKWNSHKLQKCLTSPSARLRTATMLT